ncbi:MAG: hypothetical protein M3405_13965 [Acidobacteriota bacterium]|jgi:hypothetical protein|nr:hypothetical protein [Acidobacteriota bacterium]
MDNEQILYAITIEDLKNVSEEIEMKFSESDIDKIQEKIGDFMGDIWYEAIQNALEEINQN